MRTFCLLFLAATLLSGQAFQGALRGRVTDTNDSVIPGAKVTMVEEATSASSATLTNGQGEYSFPVINPGTYTLQVESPGFKKLEQKGITISTQTAIVRDAKLEVGQVNETVNVDAEAAPLLETGDASTGQLLDRNMLEDLPNLGRNPYILARLSEAVVWTGNPKFDRMEDQSGSSQLSIAGGPTQANNYTLDGIAITDSTNRAVIIPSQEAVEEVKVQANTYDAEMGRTGGGVFNTTLRSGSNRMHGSLFGTVQDTSWLANSFFANRAGQAIPDQPFKNYGDSLGGPIRIPKVYDGRNKTFFYVATEGYRQFDAASGTLSVPTALERVGNFSQSLSTQKNGLSQVIYDPLSTNLSTGARTAFPNNILPASEISPIGLGLASFFPMPNGPTTYFGQPNYTYTVRTQDRAESGHLQGGSELLHVAEGLRFLPALRQYRAFQRNLPQQHRDSGPEHHLPARRRDPSQPNRDCQPDHGLHRPFRPEPLPRLRAQYQQRPAADCPRIPRRGQRADTGVPGFPQHFNR